MTAFQFLLILGIVAIAMLSIRFLRGESSLAIKRIFALLAALAAVLAILFPQLLTLVANFFGIGRGADLLLYVSIIGALLFAVATVRAKARSDARVTQLARSVALLEARLIENQETTHQSSEQDGESA
ncbi:MAG: DUF2304 domain-containing protein [Actinobacteria bacterium]|nr:DUF2304 domain-containing protein [Actinomycetota bacterium]